MAATLVPLGGVGKIGMNCLAVDTGADMVLVDCGMGFAVEPTFGADTVIPDFSFVEARKERLRGVWLTHGHDDHVGAVGWLAARVPLDVYGTPYTLELARRRADEVPGASVRFHEVAAGRPVDLGGIAVTAFPMPHSIVENTGAVIEAGGVRLVHTGDFSAAGDGDLAPLRQAGPADALLIDSTGALDGAASVAEEAVYPHLEQVVRGAPGAVFVGLFASNVARLGAIVGIARRTGRQVVLSGRSLESHFDAAVRAGYIRGHESVLVSANRFGGLPRNRCLAVVSGTQGEYRSALSRLAFGAHGTLFVQQGDTVVLSARRIPGNEVRVTELIGAFLSMGAQVVHPGNDGRVHVSGHAPMPVLRAAVETADAPVVIPVHGTVEHLHAVAAMARSAGRRAVVLRDGVPVRIDPGGGAAVEEPIALEPVFVDACGPVSAEVLRQRRTMAHGGVVTVYVNAAGEAVVSAAGVNAPQDLLEREVGAGVRDLWKQSACADEKTAAVRRFVARWTRKHAGRSALVLVHAE